MNSGNRRDVVSCHSRCSLVRRLPAASFALQASERKKPAEDRKKRSALEHSIEIVRHHTLRTGGFATLLTRAVHCVDQMRAVEAVAKSEVALRRDRPWRPSRAPQRKWGTCFVNFHREQKWIFTASHVH
jgi:hypothetical protein